MAWREDNRRVSNGERHLAVANASLQPSVGWRLATKRGQNSIAFRIDNRLNGNQMTADAF